MTSARERAVEYRKEAKSCLDLAARMSLRVDRERLTEMARHWLRLADLADAKFARGEEAP